MFSPGLALVGPLHANQVWSRSASISRIRILAAASFTIPAHSATTSRSRARCLAFMAEAFSPTGTRVRPSCPGPSMRSETS